MTKRNKLTIYRRHAATCPAKTSPKLDQCECPIWVHGRAKGKFIRQSLDTRSLTTAILRRDALLNGDDDPNGGGKTNPALQSSKDVTIDFAVSEFENTSKELGARTQELYLRAIRDFAEWAATQDLTLLASIDTHHVRAYFRDRGVNWKRTTAASRLTHLRVFFNWAWRERRWIAIPPTINRTLNRIGKTKGDGKTRQPFKPAEVTAILEAVETLPAADRDRARAIVYLLLYTGMRISDAAYFERDYVDARNFAQYFVIKTRKKIALAPELQRPVLDALAKLPESRVYFFQPDADDDYNAARVALRDGEEFSSLMPRYQYRIDVITKLVTRVLGIAGLPGACHRFRDTFAVNLLVATNDIFLVSQMLGHSDVRITQDHYLKLVDGYQEKLSQKTRALNYALPRRLGIVAAA